MEEGEKVRGNIAGQIGPLRPQSLERDVEERQQRQTRPTLENEPDDAERGTAQRIGGSFDPVGFSSIAQKPTSVSSLSASATATETGFVGTRSDGPWGL
jgi:hypothetical protein